MNIEIVNTTRNSYQFEITKDEWDAAVAEDREWYQENKHTDKICFFLEEMKGWLDVFSKYSFEELDEICKKNAKEPTDEGDRITSIVQDFLDTHFISNYHYNEKDLINSNMLEEEVYFDWDTDE